MEDISQTEATNKITRRSFMEWGFSWVLGAVSLAVFLAAVMRMSFPSLLPGKSGKFKIGTREDFPQGTTKYFKDQKVYVFADEEGVSAMSAVCTHLGCIVNEEETQFVCPCHGSRFDLNGKVLQGPAPKSLPWYDVSSMPNGKLVVNKNKIVGPGAKLKV